MAHLPSHVGDGGESERVESVIGSIFNRMDPKRKLKGMLARIFSDAVAEPHEREELRAYLDSKVLSQAEIHEVFDDFIQTTWKITIADGVVSDHEKARMKEIVSVLAIDTSKLPADWAKVVS